MNGCVRLMRVALVGLALGGCRVEVGNGQVMSEPRQVGAFSRVAVQNGMRAEVAVGPTEVTLTTDQNLLPLVETFVEGDTLVVRLKLGYSVSTPTGLVAKVLSPVIQGVDASGGSQVTSAATASSTWTANASGGSQLTVTGVESTNVDIAATGGSQVTLTGAATAVTAAASSGSRVTARDLEAQDVTVDGSGGSTLVVRASQVIRGVLSGGSHLTVLGEPVTRQVTISGGSAVDYEPR